MSDRSEISLVIRQLISKELNRDIGAISDEATFYDMGLDSVNSIFLLRDLEEHFNVDIDPLSLYDNPTILSFATYLDSLLNGPR